VTIDEIRVSTSDGGSSEVWTLRSNDTAYHKKIYSADERANGARDITDAVATLQEGSFTQMLDYLQWTRLFALKVPRANATGGGVTISLKRNGKAKSITIPNSVAPLSTADTASWTTLKMVRALTAEAKWRTAAQIKAGTGIAAFFQIDDVLTGEDAITAKAFPLPIYSVLNAAGKEVAVLRKNSASERAAFFLTSPQFGIDWVMDWVTEKDVDAFLTLSPGAYRLAFKKLDVAAGDPPPAAGFAWRVIYLDDKNKVVPVKTGQFNYTVIRLENKPTAR